MKKTLISWMSAIIRLATKLTPLWREEEDMANFKVYGKEVESDVVLFELREKEGRLNLFAVNKDGKKISGGHILRIDSEGIHPMNGCPSGIGFPVDLSGRVKVY